MQGNLETPCQNARQIGSSLADYPGHTLPILRKQVQYLDVPGRKLGSMGYFTYLLMGYTGVITLLVIY